MGILCRRGHFVELANNGRAAVSAVEREVFDVVLMDIQMPEMDGFEATSIIRKKEQETGGRHLPIVAMTAHAMKGDRERCLAHGMDAYISKPFQKQELLDIVDSFPSMQAAKVPDVTPVINLDQLLVNLEGDEELLGRIAALFIDQTPATLAGIRNNINLRDSTGLERSAHSFKSSIGAFGAQKAFALAQDLEQAGRDGDFAKGAGLLHELEREVVLMLALLRTLQPKQEG